MPNGKPGDHPATDIADYGKRVFTPEMDALVSEIHGFTADYGVFDPFGNDLHFLMMRARDDRSLWPELQQQLLERRDDIVSWPSTTEGGEEDGL